MALAILGVSAGAVLWFAVGTAVGFATDCNPFEGSTPLHLRVLTLPAAWLWNKILPGPPEGN